MSLFSAIALVNTGLALAMACALLFGDGRRRGVGLLITLLFMLASQQLLVPEFMLRYPIVLKLSVLVMPTVWLIGPLLHVYARMDLDMPSESRRRLLLYGAPSLIHLCVHIGLTAALPEFRDPEQVMKQSGAVGIYSTIVVLGFAVWNLVFFRRMATTLKHFRREYEDRFAGNAEEHTGWFRALLWIFSTLLLCIFTGVALNVVLPEAGGVVAMAFLVLPGSLVFYVILHHLINRPDVFRMTISGDGPPASNREAKPGLDDDTRRSYREALLRTMEEHRLFLREDLALADLSDTLGIPLHQLSMLINTDLGMNFYGFVNAYRVREAAGRLADAERKNESILEIAYDSGFKSKTAFNRAFKLMTGRTPREYRGSPDQSVVPAIPTVSNG